MDGVIRAFNQKGDTFVLEAKGKKFFVIKVKEQKKLSIGDVVDFDNNKRDTQVMYDGTDTFSASIEYQNLTFSEAISECNSY